jgi:transposase
MLAGCMAAHCCRQQGVAGHVQRSVGRHAHTCQRRWRSGSLPRQEICISLDGLFLNADAGFDNSEVRRVLDIHQIQANIAQNPRSGNAYLERDDYFDELLYRARFLIERSFAWIDGQKALMTRYEKTARNWFSMNMLGFLTILERKIT